MLDTFKEECYEICKYCGKEITNCNNLSTKFDDCCKDCESDLCQCEICAKTIQEEDAYEFNGLHYCEDCYEREFMVCDKCGEVHPIETMTLVDDEFYCEKCRDENCFKCDECGDWFLNGDKVYDGNIELCEECYDKYYFRCECCGDIEHTDNSNYVENYGNICDHCYEYSGDFRVCCDCGNLFHIDDLNWDDDNDEYYCNNCYDAYPRTIHEYGYKPQPNFAFANGQDNDRTRNLQIGFELEVDKDSSSGREEYARDVVGMLDNRVYCKSDGSLDYGFEIVSHPATFEWYNERKDTLEKVFKHLVEDGGYTSHTYGTCGLHFHCDREFIEDCNYPHTLSKLAVFYYGFYDKVYAISRRKSQSWIANFSAARNIIRSDYETPTEKLQSLDSLMSTERTNHSTVMNTANKPTIEIRLFRGTLNIDTFMLSMQFVKEVCYIAKYEIFGTDCFIWENWYNKFSPEVRAFIDANGKATRMNRQ